MKRITIEEHFTTEDNLHYLRLILDGKYPVAEVVQQKKNIERDVPYLSPALVQSGILTRLLDVGEGRLREMDEAGIDMQVLNLASPGVQVFDAPTAITLAKKFNNRLADIVGKHPDRFAGLATLPTQDPGEAARELERSVLELGLKGACINSHTRGEYLDDKKYWVILDKAQKLKVPIFIHPRPPPPNMIGPYLAYPGLDTALCGFGADGLLHAMRLICSGVFDEFPRLQIILGHLGEGLPFWLWRIDNIWRKGPLSKKLNRMPSQYVKENFFVSTSGMFSPASLLCSYLVLGADRIVFAVDHPFESDREAVQFMDEVPICESDKEKICHLNLERLLRL